MREEPKKSQQSPNQAEQEVVYVPLGDTHPDIEDSGDVYYVFHDFDGKGAITSLEDESTVDPFSEYRNG